MFFGAEAIEVIREIEDICCLEIKGFEKRYKPQDNYYKRKFLLS